MRTPSILLGLVAMLAGGCSSTHLVFSTYTKVGLDMTVGDGVPPRVAFAYKRFEGAIIPTDPSLEELQARLATLECTCLEKAKRSVGVRCDQDAAIDPEHGSCTELGSIRRELRAAAEARKRLQDAIVTFSAASVQSEQAEVGVAEAARQLARERAAEKPSKPMLKTATAKLDEEREKLEQARTRQDAAQAELSRKEIAYRETVSRMLITPVYSAIRLDNSWTRGLVMCQVFATGAAATKFDEHADEPALELIDCEVER